MSAAQSSQTPDQLFLWWVGDPGRPMFVGELASARSLRGVSLRYSDEWCARGFALDPRQQSKNYESSPPPSQAGASTSPPSA